MSFLVIAHIGGIKQSRITTGADFTDRFAQKIFVVREVLS